VPDGRAPAVEFSLTSTVSVVATVWQDSGAFHMNIWQTNPWRLHTTWSWSSLPGQNCLAGITDTLEFPENAPFTSETFSWGLVRADAAWVGVVTGPDDYDVASPIVLGSEALPGLRPWIARTTTDDPIRRFRALTEAGTVLHYAEPPTWDARPDSC
jgi:hypothetical protein